jgi:hypothetical protein
MYEASFQTLAASSLDVDPKRQAAGVSPAAFLGGGRNKFQSVYLRKGIPKYLSIQDAKQARSEFRDENKEISRISGEGLHPC